MKNFYTLFLLTMLGAPPLFAQDMPLGEIIILGETWQPHKGEMPKSLIKVPFTVTPKGTLTNGQKEFPVAAPQPTCTTMHRGYLMVASATDRHIWAYSLNSDGSLGPGDRYARCYTRRKLVKGAFFEEIPVNVTAMTVDGQGRLYAATNEGIQAFDPTGRLCGVFTAPTGKIEELTFKGSQLFARVGQAVFVRKMNAIGPK